MNRTSCALSFALIALWTMVLFGAEPAESPFSEGKAEATGESTKLTSHPEKSVLIKEGQPVKANNDSYNSCTCAEVEDSAVFVKIKRALHDPLHPSGLDFVETPLKDVVMQLQDDYGIPIQIDTPALDEVGVSADEQITVNLHNISLRSALRLMLKDYQLAYIIQDEVLIITTPDAAEKNLKICVYNVGAIVGNRGVRLDALVDAIQACVATDTWAANKGGEATIRALKPNLLVISQTAAVHEEVRGLLAAIRKSLNKDEERSASASNAAKVPNQEVVTRWYRLQLNSTNDVNAMRSQVRELITKSLPDETWSGRLTDGQGVALTVFQDRVILRQTPAVQERVQRLLEDSGVATSAQVNAGALGIPGFGQMGARGGGFFRPGFGASPGAMPAAARPGIDFEPNPGGPGFGGEAGRFEPQPDKSK